MFTAQSLARQLTEVQWDAIEQCSRVLQPFAGAQSFLEEGDQFVGLSYVPSIVASLRHHLDDMISDKPHPKPNQQQKQQQLLLQRSDDAVRQAAILVRAAFYERYLGAAHGTTTTTGDDGAERRGGGGGGDDECHSRMPESALLAAQVDPRTKFFEGIGVNSSDRALELLKARMIRRQQQEEEGAKVEAARQQALVADAAAAAAAQKKKNGHAENGKEGGQRQQQEGKGTAAALVSSPQPTWPILTLVNSSTPFVLGMYYRLYFSLFGGYFFKELVAISTGNSQFFRWTFYVTTAKFQGLA